MATIKIAHNSPSHTNPSELETQIAQAFFDLESSVSDLKASLRPLQFYSAKEIDSQGRKAVVIFVPFPLLKGFHRVQQRLTRELEKKFSDRHVVFIAHRRILALPGRRSRVQQKRPRNRTLTAVHDAILGDLVYPTEIVGKRVRTKEDGHKVIKVFLDSKDRAAVDYKVDTFKDVYRKLTGKSVEFEFPAVSGEGY